MLDEWNGIYIKSNGEKIKLTWNELYVLEYMIMHKNRSTTLKQLTEAVYGKGNFDEYRRCIGTYISRLRTKLAGEIEITNNIKIGYKIKYIGE